VAVLIDPLLVLLLPFRQQWAPQPVGSKLYPPMSDWQAPTYHKHSYVRWVTYAKLADFTARGPARERFCVGPREDHVSALYGSPSHPWRSLPGSGSGGSSGRPGGYRHPQRQSFLQACGATPHATSAASPPTPTVARSPASTFARSPAPPRPSPGRCRQICAGRTLPMGT
jgi:hypothetical protein